MKFAASLFWQILLVVSLFVGQGIFAQNNQPVPFPTAANPAEAISPFETPTPSPTPPKRLGIDTVATIPFEENRESLGKLSLTEREKLAREIRDLPPGGPSNAKINAFFRAWGAADAKAALSFAATLKTQDARNVAVEALINGMAPDAAEEVVRSMKTISAETLASETKQRLLGLALVKWSQQNPAAAAGALAELYPDAASRLDKLGPLDGVLFQTTRAVAENWGATDPQAAIAWFQHHPDFELAGGVERVLTGWWRKDSAAAAAYVTAHTDNARGRALAAAMAGRMASINPRSAAQWVEWAVDGRARRRAELEIAAAWSANDPKGASEWAAHKSDAGRNPVIGIVSATWAASDPIAAAKWIDTLKDSSRDAAIVSYSATLERRDPATALDWANKIADPKIRQRNFDRIAGRWLTRQPAEATAWMQRRGLGEKQNASSPTASQTPTPAAP